MKNKDITPQDVVPKDIRIEVYTRAIEIIENNENIYTIKDTYGLCLLLPCILWDLNDYVDNAPNGKSWGLSDARELFPELTWEVIREITATPYPFINIKRIEILTNFIKELSK